MKTSKQQTQTATYVPPCVEWMEVSIETGYIGSLGSSGNEGYEPEEGTWDD